MAVLQAPTTVENDASAASIALAFGLSVQAGSLLWCHVAFEGHSGSTTVGSVVDSLNGAWTFAVGVSNTPNDERSELYYRRNSAAGAAPTVTVTFAGTNPGFRRLSIVEVSGLLDAAPDKTASDLGTGTAASSGAATTTADGEYIAGGLQYNGVSISNLNGFTLEQAGGTSHEGGILDKTQTTAGSIAVAVTLSGSTSWAALMMTFAPAAPTSAPAKNFGFANPATKKSGIPLGFAQQVSPLLAGQDKQFAGPGQWRAYDWPLPRVKPWPADLRMIADASEFWMLVDQQFGAPGETKTYDWPVPRAPRRSVTELQAWAPDLLLTTLGAAPVLSPCVLTDYPLPSVKPFPVALRTYVDASEFWLLKDTFFGAPDQPPTNDTWPVPKGARPLLELRTWVYNLLESTLASGPAAVPFTPAWWPLPQSAAGRMDVLTWLVNLLQSTLQPAPGVPCTPIAWPLPGQKPIPIALRTWLENLLQSTLAVVITGARPQPIHASGLYRLSISAGGVLEFSVSAGGVITADPVAGGIVSGNPQADGTY